MADNKTTSDRPARAITDLYDEQKREFLVQYPTVLIVTLGLAGVVAFMLVGFLGYRDRAEPDFTQTVFHQPWPLYLYFCALVMALQISIFRHPLLRRQLMQCLPFRHPGLEDFQDIPLVAFVHQQMHPSSRPQGLLDHWPERL